MPNAALVSMPAIKRQEPKKAEALPDLHPNKAGEGESRKDISPRPLAEAFGKMRLEAKINQSDEDGESRQRPPEARRHFVCPLLQFPGGFLCFTFPTGGRSWSAS